MTNPTDMTDRDLLHVLDCARAIFRDNLERLHADPDVFADVYDEIAALQAGLVPFSAEAHRRTELYAAVREIVG